MGRKNFQRTFTDGQGRVVQSGSITVYDAGTTNLSTIYSAETGGTPITGSVVTTGPAPNGTGVFNFWVDDYTERTFDIFLSASGLVTQKYPSVKLIPKEIYRYYVNPGETDQGVAGNGNSVKAHLNAIGSTRETIVFKPGTYTFATSVTIPANVFAIVERGALFNNTTGSISFAAGSVDFINPEWWGVKGDGTTDDTSAMQAALNATLNGMTFRAPKGSGDYLINDTGIDISSTTYPKTDCVIIFDGDIKHTGSNIAVRVTAFYNSKLYMKRIYSNTALNWGGSAMGIRIRASCYDSYFEVNKIDNFAKGMYLYADTGGISHCTFGKQELLDNKVQIHASATDPGYITANEFGPQNTTYANPAIIGVGCVCVQMDTQVWGNVFEGGLGLEASAAIPAVERAKMYAIYDSYGDNRYKNPWIEGITKLYFGPSSYGVRIEDPIGGWDSSVAIEGSPERSKIIDNRWGQSQTAVINGSFESWVAGVPSGWTVSGLVVSDATDWMCGTKSAKIPPAAYVEQDLLPMLAGSDAISEKGRAVSGKLLSVGMWIRANAANDCEMKLIEAGGSNTTITRLNASGSTGGQLGGWQWTSIMIRLGDHFVTPITSVKLRITAHASANIWVDGVTANLSGEAFKYSEPAFDVAPFTTISGATPSVKYKNVFKVTNGAATNVTDFLNGIEGQEIKLIFTDGNTTLVDGGNLKLAGNFVSTADDVVKLISDGSVWYEISRSVN